MIYICHRINTIEELSEIPKEYGVELDLRDCLDGSIHIAHNPYECGENFEEYLKKYHCSTMILNIKSERIEWRVLELLKKYNIKDYFFLDSSFPMIWTLSEKGNYNNAIRVSEYEGMDTARLMRNRAKWIWVDCFSKFPINVNDVKELKKLGYKLCLVSPDLQGRPEEIADYALKIKKMEFDAVCTKRKNIKEWEHLLAY